MLSTKEIRVVVCICNAIKERDVRAAARGGASCPASVYAACGKRARCGQCFSFARQIIAAERVSA